MNEADFDREFPNLATKIFSETVCQQCESNSIPNTDAMGRDQYFLNDPSRL